MAKVTFTIDDKLFQKQMRKITRFVDKELPKQALVIYRKETPKDTGNAQRKTKRRGKTIIGDYAYSNVLDSGKFPNPPKQGTGKTINGFSTQAKKGMATPTIAKLDILLDRFVRKVKGR
jgi:hypothetical protein